MRRRRADEIDFYEELGLERGATPDEIRDSFRALVRLLHPDHQQDENLRAIAEKQLRKLNRIYAVLADPDRRRRYDISLDEELRPPSIVIGPLRSLRARELITRFIWVCTAVLCVLLIIWLAADSPAPPVYSAADSAGASRKNTPQTSPAQPAAASSELPTVQAAAQDENSQLRAALRAARSERDDAKRELAEMKSREEAAAVQQTASPPPAAAAPATSASIVQSDPAPPRVAAVPVVHPSTPPVAAVSTPPEAVHNVKPPMSEAHQFAGFWFFSKATQPNRNKNLYYPEFIEATLTEQNGLVHGRYRSRYQIVDRAISPDVNFEFSGTPTSGTMVCTWTGPGGAKGQLTLKMVGENDLKIDWTASDIGTIQGLASGTATLSRRLE